MKIVQYLQASPFFAIHRSYEIISRELRGWLQGDDLNFLQALVLLSLFFEDDNEVRPSMLADSFQTSRGNVSHCVTYLERKGYVKRHMRATDARGYNISLTPSGKSKARSLVQKFDRLQRILETRLGESEVEGFNKTIRTITKYYAELT